MNESRLIFATLACLALASCSSPESLELTDLANVCSSDADCQSGACASDGSTSLCVATKADLANLFFEIALPNDAPVAPGARFVARASELGLDLQGVDERGYARPFAWAIVGPAEVRALFEVKALPDACSTIAAGGRVRSNIEVYPVGQPIGVSLPPYSGEHDEGFGGPRVSVPTGRYDIYIKPDLTLAAECDLPPVLIKNQAVVGDTELRYARTSAARLVGHLNVPHPPECDADAAKCWRVELLDNQRGRVLGSAARLSPEGTLGTERFELRYWRGNDPIDELDPVLVVHPPPNLRQAGIPDLYWKLAAIDPDGDLDVSLDLAPLFDAVERYIPLEASVRGVAGNPVSAQVLVLSRKLLDGKFGDNAVFQAALATDASGNFALNLLPGKYDLVAIPTASSDAAVTIASWSFGDSDLGKGRTLEVKPVSRLSGVVRTPSGRVAANLPVRVAPSASEDTSLLEATFSPGQLALLGSLPRTMTAVTDIYGRFDLSVDPGQLDLFIEPPASSHFPRLVRRSVAVSPSQPQALELGELSLTEPVLLWGATVATDGAPISGVTIRAWLGTNPTKADERPSAVSLGEAVSDADGRYRLLLPASVAP